MPADPAEFDISEPRIKVRGLGRERVDAGHDGGAVAALFFRRRHQLPADAAQAQRFCDPQIADEKNRDGNRRRYPAGKLSTLPPDDGEGPASDLSALVEDTYAVGNRGGDLGRAGSSVSNIASSSSMVAI